jgi:hypothetical protein
MHARFRKTRETERARFKNMKLLPEKHQKHSNT